MPPSRAAKIRRRALVILGAVAGLAVVTLAVLSQTASFRDWLRRRVVALATARTNGHVRIGALDGNLFGRLVATDVRVELEGQRVLAVRRLVATYDVLRSLVAGEFRVRTLVADGVALQLIGDERGWNAERLVKKPARDDDDLVLALESVRIANGALRVVRPERVWRLRGMTIAGTARITPHAQRFALDGVTFTEQGSGVVLVAGTGRLTLDRDAGVSVDAVRLRTERSEITFDGRFGPRPTGEVEARLRVPRLAASEVRALFGARAPESDWVGELHAGGPESAVAVTAELAAEAPGDGAPRPAGRARIDGTVDVRNATPVGNLRATLDHLDLAAVGGPRLPASDLSGALRLATETAAPRTVQFALDLRAPRIGNTSLASLAASGTAAADDVRFDASATAADGTVRVTGSVAPKAQRFDLHVAATELDPGALTGRTELAGRVNGTATLAGEGFVPATTRAELTLAVAPSRIGAVAVREGTLAARSADGRVTVARARIATNVGDADASGDLALGSGYTPGAGALHAEAQINDLRPLAALLGRPGVSGAATATLIAGGSPNARELEAHVKGRGVAVGARRLTSLDADGWWKGGASEGRGAIDVRGREGDAQRQLAADVTHAKSETRVAITKLRIDHQDETWTAIGSPVLVQRGERLTIEDFAMRSGRGSLRARGVVTRTAENDLDLLVDGLDLDALDWDRFDDIKGRLVGHAHLGGTLAAPQLDAEAKVDNPTLGGVRYDELGGHVVVTASRAELHGRLVQTRDQALTVDGTLPVRFALVPWCFEITEALAGRVHADGIDVAFLGSLWPGLVTKAGGTIHGDVTLSGSVAAPEAHGTVTLAGGRAYLVPLGLTYDPVDLELRLDGRTASIARLAIQSGKGRLTGGGDARFGSEGPLMDARFEVDHFPLFANQYGHGAASGWLWISGSLAEPVLEGSLETDGLVLQIPEVLPTATRKADPTIVVIGPGAPAPSVAPVSTRPAPSVPGLFDRAAITVQLDVPREAWVRRSDANVELKGWMTAWKKPGEPLQLAGDIRGVRGWYAFQGKKFTLAEGDVRFTGQGLDPVLDITATHTAGEYLVRLRVGGTITKPTLALESEPALDQADVLSVLLFGSPASQLSRSQSVGLREQALGIAGGYVASELRQSVANALGVDDLQFDTGTTGLQDARVSIGKYVADDIFVSLAHRFGAQSVEEIRIEYVIRPEWSLETSSDTLGRSGVDLFWKRRY